MLLTIKEFASQTKMSYLKAFELTHSQELIDHGVTVKLTPPEKKGGYRVDYEKFIKYAVANNIISKSGR